MFDLYQPISGIKGKVCSLAYEHFSSWRTHGANNFHSEDPK